MELFIVHWRPFGLVCSELYSSQRYTKFCNIKFMSTLWVFERQRLKKMINRMNGWWRHLVTPSGQDLLVSNLVGYSFPGDFWQLLVCRLKNCCSLYTIYCPLFLVVALNWEYPYNNCVMCPPHINFSRSSHTIVSTNLFINKKPSLAKFSHQ